MPGASVQTLIHNGYPINVSPYPASESGHLGAISWYCAQLGCVNQHSPCDLPIDAMSFWEAGTQSYISLCASKSRISAELEPD